MTETEEVHIQHLDLNRFDQLCGPTVRNYFILTEGKIFDKMNDIVNGDNFH